MVIFSGVVAQGASIKFGTPKSNLDACTRLPKKEKIVGVYSLSVVGKDDLERYVRQKILQI